MTSLDPSASVTLVASRVRPEEKAIVAALDAAGLAWTLLDPRSLAVPASGRDAPGVPDHGVVLVREIAQHRAAVVARGLEGPGRVVVNGADAIETCASKWATAVALRSHGVPTPQTWAVTSTQGGLDLIERLGYPVVVKPQASSWGRRVSLVTDHHAARAVLEHCEALPSPQAKLPLVQEYVPATDGDVRVLVVGGVAIAAERRRSPGEWRHNVARGAGCTPEPLDTDPEVADLSVAAARAVGAQVAGVDLLRDATGRWLVLEVNAGVEFAGLERATGCDAAGRIVALCRSLVTPRRTEVA